MLVGYARVSTRHQETSLQLDALHAAGVKTVFQEKASSVGARPQLRVCIASLQPGDVLVFYKLDRVARSLKDLLGIIEEVGLQGAAIRSLTEPLDTSTPMGVFVLQILGAVAQLERNIIRQRAIAGQVAYIKRGGKLGRARSLTVEQEAEARQLLLSGINRQQVANRFGVSYTVADRIWKELHGHCREAMPVLKKFM